MQPELTVVIVTYKSRNEIGACLTALRRSRSVELDVCVVDSRSDDDSLALAAAADPAARLISMRRNAGFGAACNVGANTSKAPFLLFLNPDTIVEPDALRTLLDYLRAQPRAAIVGPRIVDAHGASTPAARTFPSPRGEFARLFEPLAKRFGCLHAEPPGAAGPVDWVSGASLLVRAEAWRRVGPFDERFFLYFEETDWCRRAWSAGLEVHHCPTAQLVHLGGTSARASGSKLRAGCVAAAFVDSRRRYFKKHHGALAGWAVELLHAARNAYEKVA